MLLSVGVVGYSHNNFDRQRAQRLIREAFDEIQHVHSSEYTQVVSGLSDSGIPALAYREAKRRSWLTSGVACSQVLGMKQYDVAIKAIVGENWGDESEVFLNSIDILVRVGGGSQAFAETDAFKARKKPVYEYDLEELVD